MGSEMCIRDSFLCVCVCVFDEKRALNNTIINKIGGLDDEF